MNKKILFFMVLILSKPEFIMESNYKETYYYKCFFNPITCY
ncbi:hypothetical protein PLEI_4238 [Photobacterium leiognathi lrivu.4.1]|uniref:Uncharacterized protein n=1 Tax=Photobacterium leiognathi lrivu.4.1 TaxID=1248232 RepID=V5ERX5_PHOLE|nr:hypothetical protein PLEI_4238 [Photobacterium leiognathi lrivu.4.1]